MIDARAGKIVARVPLTENPNVALPGRTPEIVYVLHNGGPFRIDWFTQGPALWKKPSSLSVVDWRAEKVIKTIPLSWNVQHISLSEDGHHLLAVGEGRVDKRKPRPDEQAFTHWIDTGVHEELRRMPTGLFVPTPHGSRVFSAASKTYAGKPTLSVFDAGRAEPVASIALPGIPSEAFLSADSKWLYVVDFGWPDKNKERNREALVHVVDAVSGNLVASHLAGTGPRGCHFDKQTGILTVLSNKSVEDHTGQVLRWRDGKPMGTILLGKDPLWLFPAVTVPGAAVVSESEACLLNGEFRVEKPCIDLTTFKVAYMEGSGRAGFKGFPLLDLQITPSRERLIIRGGKNGDQVSLADIRSGKCGVATAIGSAGARGARVNDKVLKGVAIGTLALLGGKIVDWPSNFGPWWAVPMEVRGDGKFVYIPNFYTNEVTIFDLDSGKGLKDLALDGRPLGLLISAAGARLVGYSANKVILLDTERNEPILEASPPGAILDLHCTEDSTRIVAATKKGVLVWDTGSAKPLASFTDLAKTVSLAPLQGKTN